MPFAQFDSIPAVALDQMVHRYWVAPDRRSALDALGLDPEDIQETLQLLGGGQSSSALDEFLDFPFRRQTAYKGRRPRFSDGNLLAFYSAAEPETAEAEAAPRDGIPCYKDHFACRFQGRAKDLLQTGWEFLIGESAANLDSCLQIARRARTSGIQAVKTPSAKRPTGTCIPVWDRSTLSAPTFVRTVRFEVDPSGQPVHAVEV